MMTTAVGPDQPVSSMFLSNVTSALQSCVAQGCAVENTECLDTCLREDEFLSGFECTNETSTSDGLLPLAASIPLAIVLVCLSALFSGLTLGLLSLDMVALRVLSTAGDENEKGYANKIIPIRTNGNLLLCTLLLGNTIVNNGFSILLAGMTSELLGLIISVTAVLIFGEITPQAICSRHALFIGAHTIWLVKFFRVLFFPVSYPLSLILNYFLGRDIGNVYSVDEMKRLIELHATDMDMTQESGLNASDHLLLVAALEYKDKRVSDVMTSLDQCYMLDVEERLTFSLMLEVYRSGYTRIPVYRGVRTNIVGVLYAKDLILVDPEDEIELATILAFRGRHSGHVSAGTKLDQALAKFLSTGMHLMIVHSGKGESYPVGCSGTGVVDAVDGEQGWLPTAPVTNVDGFDAEAAGVASLDDIGCDIETPTPNDADNDKTDTLKSMKMVRFEPGTARPDEDGEVVGIITLEDVIEEVIRREIVDESDIYEDVEAQLPRRIARQNDIDAFLQMFERKEVQDRGLAAEEAKAVMAYLTANVEEFRLLGKNEVAMRTLIETAVLIDRATELHSSTSFKSPGQGPGSAHGSNAGTPTRGQGFGSSPSGGRDAFSAALDDREGRSDSFSRRGSQPYDDELVLYRSGVESTKFVLILQGKVEVTTTSEHFNFEMGPWSVLGNKALTQDTYVPDFVAVAMAPCRILTLEKAAYQRAVQQVKIGLVLGGPRSIAKQEEVSQQARKSGDEGPGGTGRSRFFEYSPKKK